MNLLDEVENYLASVTNITMHDEGLDTQLVLLFPMGMNKKFECSEGTNALHQYFLDREIVLVIKAKELSEEEAYYRNSLVDTKTADTINLNNAFWGKGDLNTFKEKFSSDSKITLRLGQLNESKNDFKLCPPSDKQISLKGYRFEELQDDE